MAVHKSLPTLWSDRQAHKKATGRAEPEVFAGWSGTVTYE